MSLPSVRSSSMPDRTVSAASRITITEVGTGFEGEPRDSRPRWIRRVLIALASIAGLSLVGLFLLGYADYQIAGNGSSSTRARIQWVWVHGDHLHFAVHIAQARLFDICPCTRRVAAEQYRRARFHAVTLRQQAVAANSHPQSIAAWVDYFVGPFAVGVEWLQDGMSWIAGHHPTQQVTVQMNDYEFQPAEISVTRGTTVTWRNTDDLGEAHAVATDRKLFGPFEALPLEPEETFAYTFTERGAFTYFCGFHGAPGRQGMAGVIVVQ